MVVDTTETGLLQSEALSHPTYLYTEHTHMLKRFILLDGRYT